MARIKRYYKKRSPAKLILIISLILFTASVFYLIKNTRQPAPRPRSVLNELKKNYNARQTGKTIYVYPKAADRINIVLSDVEEILASANKTITHYSVDHAKDYMEVVLDIEDKFVPEEQGKIIIYKKFSEITRETVTPPPVQQTFRKKPQICIIIDDAGYHNQTAYQLIKLPVKMGIAVIPFLPDSKKIAELIHENNKEVLLHLPMEPEGYKERHIRLLPKTLLCDMNSTQIHSLLEDMLQNVPHVIGINNHQGSRVTADPETMRIILSFINEKGLFFIDSLTSSRSVTEGIAEQTRTHYGKRDIFLDNVNNYSYIKKQMDKLIQKALKQGKAIGIGHVERNNTFKVLRDYIPIMEAKGIELVYPSDIVVKFNKEVSNNVKDNIILIY